jgi:hypothetical protein
MHKSPLFPGLANGLSRDRRNFSRLLSQAAGRFPNRFAPFERFGAERFRKRLAALSDLFVASSLILSASQDLFASHLSRMRPTVLKFQAARQRSVLFSRFFQHFPCVTRFQKICPHPRLELVPVESRQGLREVRAMWVAPNISIFSLQLQYTAFKGLISQNLQETSFKALGRW